MTVITLTTVGYDEVIPLEAMPGGRGFTLCLILTGMGLVLFFASSLTAFIIDGDLRTLWTRRKMLKSIENMTNHYIVCGFSRPGMHADSVVFPDVIGGRRIASELVRPDVVSFLEVMIHDREHSIRVEQIAIPADSNTAGKTLATAGIRDAGDVLVVAIRGPDTEIAPGDKLIVLGEVADVADVRNYVEP